MLRGVATGKEVEADGEHTVTGLLGVKGRREMRRELFRSTESSGGVRLKNRES